MQRINRLILTAFLAVALCSVAASFLPASLTQERARLNGCGCFTCGDLAREASRRGENLPFVYLLFEDTACSTILAEEACPAELSKLPQEKRAAFCRKIKDGLKFTSFKDSCPLLAASCEPETEKAPENQPKDDKRKCGPPTPPWFSSQDCKDLQDPIVEFSRERLDVYLCGYKIFSRTPETAANPNVFTDPLFAQAYKSALNQQLRDMVPRKVCCNQFRQAAMTGRPCDSAADVDCDGRLNNIDANGDLPEINGLGFTEAVPSTESRDPFPKGLNEDALMPAAQCKDCKWELIKGVLKCNADPSQRHSYEATWRCPTTGAIVEVVKLSPPGVNCVTR